MNPIVMKMENSRHGPPEPPESSAYRRAINVGTGAKRYRRTTKKGHQTLQTEASAISKFQFGTKNYLPFGRLEKLTHTEVEHRQV